MRRDISNLIHRTIKPKELVDAVRFEARKGNNVFRTMDWGRFIDWCRNNNPTIIVAFF